MSKRLITIFVAAIFALVSFTGCDSDSTKRELGALAIVIGLAIDKNEGDNQGFETFGQEQDKILMTAQVVRNDSVGQQGSQGRGGQDGETGDVGKPYWNVEVVGENLLETIRAATHIANRSLYLAQNQVVIISSEVAREGIAKYLDFFFRDHETRYDVSLVISEKKAGDILATESHLDNLPALDLYKLIKSQNKDSGTPECTLFSFIRDYKTQYKSTLVPLVKVKEQKEQQRSDCLFVSGSAVFVEDKMVGTLNEKETRGVLWLTDDVSHGVIAFDFNGNPVSLEIINSKGSFEAEHSEGKIIVKGDVQVDVSLGEYCGEGELSIEEMKQIELLCCDAIQKEIYEGFDSIKEKGADVLGVGDYFYRYKNEEWQQIRESFLTLYKEATAEVEIDVNLLRTGSLLKPIDAGKGD